MAGAFLVKAAPRFDDIASLNTSPLMSHELVICLDFG
jgi:hypothetical protein